MGSFNSNTQDWCPCCRKAKSKASFIAGLNKNFEIPYCKTCLNKKLNHYKEVTESDGASLYCLCAELCYPVIKEYYDIANKIYVEKGGNRNNDNLFLIYHNVLKDMGLQVEGLWQSDMELSDFMKIREEAKKEEAEETFDYEVLQKKWGRFTLDDGLDTEAYDFLEYTFDDYTKNLTEMDTNLERRYRDLAKAEYRKRKADESGDIQEISKAQDSLKKILDMLKLSDFSKQETDERKKFIDKIAWMIEETEPAEEEDESKYRDIAGYEKVYNSFMRSMRNILCRDKNYPDIPKSEM